MPYVPSPAFRGRFGASRKDITPPLGIYSRHWGAALTDQATSIHRPMTLTVLTIQEDRSDAKPFVLLSLDLCAWAPAGEGAALSRAVMEAGIEADHFILAPTHTHAGPVINPELAWKPGGEHIAGYLQSICRAIYEAVTEAVTKAQTGFLDVAPGSCSLAANRDLPDPEKKRFLVGWNPAGKADQTVLVGRVASLDGTCIATLVNYACHPTILAWENTAISTDYVGAMREVVEKETCAPCLFLQGASGELAPRRQYVGDPRVADRAGQSLGHAVLSVLYEMDDPGTELVYEGVAESGAPLALWYPRPRKIFPSKIQARKVIIDLPIKTELPTLVELETQLLKITDRAMQERLQRKLLIRMAVGNDSSYPSSNHLWKIGGIFFAAISNEAYGLFQQELRTAAGLYPVFVITLANGCLGYLPPRDLYSHDIYSVWQTPFDLGSVESSILIFGKEIQSMIEAQE